MSDVYYKIDSKDLLDEMDHIIISSISTPCKEAVEKSGGVLAGSYKSSENERYRFVENAV